MGAERGLAAKLGDVLVGLPHVTQIARKPEGVGTEYHSQCCAETKIMLQLEIQEGKVKMEKEYAHLHGSGTSSLLCLTKPWSGSDCTVVADSAFASLKSAQALQNIVVFIRLVKTAHKQFSKAKLQHPQCGDHCIMQATVEGRQYMAVGWYDRKMKLFIASTSQNTDVANPAYKKHYRVPHRSR